MIPEQKMLRLFKVLTLVAYGCCAAYAADSRTPDLDMARRITGHYAPEDPVADLKVNKWDPMSEEARKYIRFMNARPSRVFVNKPCCEMPKQVGSLEDLEDIVFSMHQKLERVREIELSAGASLEKLSAWLDKVNTLQYLQAQYYEQEDRLFLQVYYFSDAKVFAAFRNPALMEHLSANEEELLMVCSQWICDNIQEDMPNMLKIKKVHDALVDNSKYTSGFYDTYNLIVKGKGVCAAYTSSTQLLLHMLKVDCRSVMGTPQMNHIWNIIDVNGEWYHTDVTWDDPVMPSGEDVKRFYYFLISRAEVEPDHEMEDPDLYPETPAVNKIGLFKRHDHREVKDSVDENDQEEYPRERESIFNTLAEMRRQEIEHQGDEFTHLISPVTETVAPAAASAAKSVKNLVPDLKANKKKRKSAEYKPLRSLDDLYYNLELCVKKLDGPTVSFDIENTCSCFIQLLCMADYHLYVKYWNFRPDKKKKKLVLDIVHWPHARILSAHRDKDLASEKLTPEERKTLRECLAVAEKFGAVWKLDRQKLGDVYEQLIHDITWRPGESGIVGAMQQRESGSLGYTEALHVVLSMMGYNSQIIPGRTDKSIHAWLVMQRDNKKWYHVDVALDAEKENKNKARFQYLLKCDDDVFDSHVWDLKEVPPTPIRDRKRAAKQGLIRSRDTKVPGLKLPLL